ncbi:hypothetical protein [Bdellovibrio svalbardensis]|uniref:Uncharacterized protein n=1 Tax=Bdellovibrio svalbardensis TaxID=2972972 RepID=A0ABT6DMB4_9BACT|nr:hypothetical protein [Bdellovibrio svalbardensis]MDG0817637.1 hypothetical protein [Bdellovibrio svalbardensis]
MIKELWNSFPRILEQRINALLDEAEPTPAKAFQIYKACKNESLWTESFDKFSKHLENFFSLPKSERRKSVLDSVLDAPMSMATFEGFHLNFRNAAVDNHSLLNLANWAHHLMRLSYKTDCVVISEDVLGKTLHYITHPPLFEKAQDIEFEDFCSAWKKIVFKLFGKKYDGEFNKILSELQWLNAQLKLEEQNPSERAFAPTIYLTQTEIDWTIAVQAAATEHQQIPKFPLSRGPQKPRLMDLERTIRLYNIVQTTKDPEFIKHRDNIRATILDRCASLLREKAS